MSVDESAAWAKAIRVADVLTHGHPKNAAICEPRLAVQSSTLNVVLCDAPVERYSKSTPAFTPRSPAEDEGWRPIDVLYGGYDPRTRCIEIYVHNIKRDASLYGEFEDVLQIVRLHEYAHAIVHLGVRLSQVSNVLAKVDTAGVTEWDAFVESRTRAFEEVDSTSHEFLAQAITLAVIASLPNDSHRKRLRATFEALERRQPPDYQIPGGLKDLVHAVDWSVVVAAARREIDLLRGEGFSLHAGLAALVRELGAHQDDPLSDDSIDALLDVLRRSSADLKPDDPDAVLRRSEQICACRQRLELVVSFLAKVGGPLRGRSEEIKAALQRSETECFRLIARPEGLD